MDTELSWMQFYQKELYKIIDLTYVEVNEITGKTTVFLPYYFTVKKISGTKDNPKVSFENNVGGYIIGDIEIISREAIKKMNEKYEKYLKGEGKNKSDE